jgi:hypothetical protein
VFGLWFWFLPEKNRQEFYGLVKPAFVILVNIIVVGLFWPFWVLGFVLSWLKLI